MGDESLAGLFFWGGVLAIAYHYHGNLGMGIVLVIAALLMIIYQSIKEQENE